jgi:hypothetical protein
MKRCLFRLALAFALLAALLSASLPASATKTPDKSDADGDGCERVELAAGVDVPASDGTFPVAPGALHAALAADLGPGM